jgi:hypothetical protein
MYRLAKIAKSEGVVLSELSRVRYMDYAIAKGCDIGDNALRAARFYRDCEDIDELMEKKKEIRNEP